MNLSIAARSFSSVSITPLSSPPLSFSSMSVPSTVRVPFSTTDAPGFMCSVVFVPINK